MRIMNDNVSVNKLEEYLQIGKQIIEGLAELHERLGIIHKDLSPKKILFRQG